MNTNQKKILCWAVAVIIFMIIVMEVYAYFKEKNRGKSEKGYLPGTYYLKKQAQPDPYPNFPGSIV